MGKKREQKKKNKYKQILNLPHKTTFFQSARTIRNLFTKEHPLFSSSKCLKKCLMKSRKTYKILLVKNKNAHTSLLTLGFGERVLQSLANGDRVNGDGELVDDHNGGEDDGDGDAGKGQEPALDGSKVALDEEITSHGGGGEGAAGLLGGVLETTAIAELAADNVVREGVGDAQKAEEGDDQGDEDEGSNGEESDTEDVHAKDEEELVADGAGEAHNEEEGEDAGNNEGNEEESLEKLEGGPHRGSGVVLSEGVDLNGTSGLDAAGHTLEGPVDVGGVDGGLGGAGGSHGGGGHLPLLIVGVPVDDGCSNADGEDGEGGQSSEAVELGELGHLG
jgi:hypothetical protein